jgi:hypothetical protein
MVKLGLIILSSFLSLIVLGQETTLPEKIITIAEELASDDSDPEAASTYTDRLEELAENPVRLNSSGEEEISRLFFLSDFQVKILMDYIHSSGKIVSVYELVNIPGFDKETAEMMIPFITLDSKPKMSLDSLFWKNTVLTNLCFKSGNGDTTSMGPPWKMLNKYKFSAGAFSGGITTEKDPGEKFFMGSPPLPDFISANLLYNGSGIIRRFIAGDYSARFGMGTNINTGIRTGLSLTATGYLPASDEIRQYSSADENNFFRGVAAEFSVKNLVVDLFYSKNNIDATLGSTSGTSKDIVENFYQAGLHNTPSLLLKKDVISDINYGLNISCNFAKTRIGTTYSEELFSLPVITSGNDPKDLFNFNGDRNQLCSFYYNSLIKKILIYGEFSVNNFKKYSLVQGISFRPSDRLAINFLFRNYEAGYFSFHGKGPGSSSGKGNEEEILGNFTFEAARHLFISGGCDLQSFKWLKYRCSAPSSGIRQEIRVRFLPTQKLTLEALYNYRLSMLDITGNAFIPDQQEIKTKSIKLTARYSLYENLTIGTRVDFKVACPSGSKGILLLQDLNYKFKYLPITVWLRYCVYNTDSWDSRLYTYENDLLYNFSIPALSGEGSRSYIMAKWEISNYFELRIKYGITSLNESASSKNETSEFKMQFRILF